MTSTCLYSLCHQTNKYTFIQYELLTMTSIQIYLKKSSLGSERSVNMTSSVNGRLFSFCWFNSNVKFNLMVGLPPTQTGKIFWLVFWAYGRCQHWPSVNPRRGLPFWRKGSDQNRRGIPIRTRYAVSTKFNL